MGEKAHLVPALERGLSTLELMAATPDALNLTGIARGLGLTVSEVQRTVASLLEQAYLVKDESGAYRLSSKLFRIATAHPPFRDLAARALGPMQRFADATNESVHLGVLRDDQLLLVSQIEGRGFVRLSLQLGATQDPLTTVSGRILLAGLPQRELTEVLRRRKLKAGEHARVQSALWRLRETGFEHSTSSRVEGVRDLGIPVTLPGGRVIAALTTSWLPLRRGRSGYEHLKAPLFAAAKEISESYEPSPKPRVKRESSRRGKR